MAEPWPRLGISPALSFTLSAFGARTRNVIFLSDKTSGETTRGPWGPKPRGGRLVGVEVEAEAVEVGVAVDADWAVPLLFEDRKREMTKMKDRARARWRSRWGLCVMRAE